MDDKTLEKLVRITDKMKADNNTKTDVVKEYADKDRKKALTQAERLDRIERILNIK